MGQNLCRRLFVAIEFPQHVRHQLLSLQERVKGQTLASADHKMQQHLKWVPPENFHITVAFIGDLAWDWVPALCDQLEKHLTEVAPFTINTEHVSYFPSECKAKVIAINVCASQALNILYDATVKALELASVPYKAGRHFRPHISIARVKGPFVGSDDVFADKSTVIASTVKHVHLMQSQTDPQGPIYTVLKSFSLEGVAP